MDPTILNRLVLGTAGLAGIWGKVDERESIRVIHRALDLGFDHFDSAPAYADAELLLARALSTWSGSSPFISTKAGRKKADGPDAAIFDYSPASLTQSVDESRRRFQRDTLDMVFLHDPGCMRDDEMKSAIDTLIELQQKGRFVHLGIGGNFGPSFEVYASSGCFDHFMGYNRYNLVVKVAQEEEFPLLKKAGISLWQASPLYMGLLGNKFQDYVREKPEWIPLDHLQIAIEMKQWCDEMEVSLTGVALNYVMMSRCVDKMVIGASTMSELDSTLKDLHSPSLRDAALHWLPHL